ncbi:MAG: DNA polymerase IV [Anaerolineae bacterium]|nr:DNA polymerase IV [Anaerolineae bacterium]
MTRKILHLDLDAFFCAVEAQHTPTLAGKPFAVGGRPDQRGVVASCSYEARVFGIHSAMPMAQAVRLCPELIIVPSHRSRYEKASQAVMGHLHELTPFVEQLSIDEAFLDVTLLNLPGEEIAIQLQAIINADPGLPCSLGVASNKLVAKIANTVGKAEASRERHGAPNAIKVIPPGEEAAFLAPLPITELWGVGPSTAKRLAELNIRSIGDLAAWPVHEIERRFGAQGVSMARHARGLDDREVETAHLTKSISQEITFEKDVRDATTLHHILRRLADTVGRRVRQEALAGATIKLKLRWSDFTTLTRQITLPQPTDQDDEIYAAAVQLLADNWPPGKPVRLIGLGISSFGSPQRQMGLWDDPQEVAEKRRLQTTLDDLRERFGDDAIQRGSDLTRRPRKKPDR